ncbi:MAG TPA: DUF2125 domain-containing protein [Acidocella sp.]|nr:DUF2125 domain-containing protein [Acidocella sp.]HQU03143.1 DUF2125 domain-containing protein [Acidocella sp.]
MRALLKLLVSLVVIVSIAWVGLWWYAQGRIQNGFQAWAEAQAVNGVKISYSSAARGTSPLQALVTINNLVFTVSPSDSDNVLTVTLPSVGLRVDATNPTVFHVDLPNKIAANLSGKGDVAINTGLMSASEQLDPSALFNPAIYPFKGGDFIASDIDILASQGSFQVMHIDSITGHSDTNINADSTQNALDATLTIDGMGLSSVLTRLASVPFNGKITHLGYSISLSGPVPPDYATLAAQIRALPASDNIARQKLIVPIIHKWAATGGNGKVSLAVTIGPTDAATAASLKFDGNLQPTGTADLTANHLEQLTSAITAAYPGLQDYITQGEAMLSQYLSTSPSDGQNLAMHATYGPAGVTINGQKVADQPPLDWDQLANPPAPPVTSGTGQ